MPAGKRSPQRPRPGNNAARERSRVKTLKMAFLDLQRTLPAVPRDTKLSKLDVLVLATTYIAHLTKALAATAPCADYGGCGCQASRQGGESCCSSSTEPKTTSSSVSPGTTSTGTTCYPKYRPSVSDPKDRAIAGCSGSVRVDFPGQGGGGQSSQPFCSDRPFLGQTGCGIECPGKASVPKVRVEGYLHPVKKWPMRTRLYAGIMASARDLSSRDLSSRDYDFTARSSPTSKSGAAKKWPF